MSVDRASAGHDPTWFASARVVDLGRRSRGGGDAYDQPAVAGAHPGRCGLRGRGTQGRRSVGRLVRPVPASRRVRDRLRMVLEMLFGVRLPGTVLFTLPSIDLPDWAAGVSLGGPVTVEMLLDGFTQGLRLAVVLACFGAANTLASPYRLLRSLPTVLYEAGVVVTVALSFAPQVVMAAGRRRQARRLRGRTDKGLARHAGHRAAGVGRLARSVGGVGRVHGCAWVRTPSRSVAVHPPRGDEHRRCSD